MNDKNPIVNRLKNTLKKIDSKIETLLYKREFILLKIAELKNEERKK